MLKQWNVQTIETSMGFNARNTHCLERNALELE